MIIALMLLGWFVRLIRPRYRPDPQASRRSISATAQPIQTTASPARPDGRKRRLVLRVGEGLLTALLVIVCSHLSWPIAGPVTMALAPLVHPAQIWIWNNRDLLLIGSVILAMVEPQLVGSVRALRLTPWTLWLLGRLICVGMQIEELRLRRVLNYWAWQIGHRRWCRERRQFLAACSQQPFPR
jgi:hypothetical protein